MSTTILGKVDFGSWEVRIDANTVVNKGDHVASFSSGNGYAKTADLATNIVFLGRAESKCDNTNGAAGAKAFMIQTGRIVYCQKFKNDETAPCKDYPQASPTTFGKVYLSAPNTVSPNNGLLASLIARITDIKTKFLAHAAGTGTYHGTADGASYTITTPTTAATVYTACGELKTVALAHVVKVSGSPAIHGAADLAAQGALSALVIPTSLEEAKVFIEAFAGIMFGTGGHTNRTSPAVHGAADATNVLTSSAAVATNPLVGRQWGIDSNTGLVIVERLEA
jgi:hypothetical protein